MPGKSISAPELVVVERRPWLVPAVAGAWCVSIVVAATLSAVLFSKQARDLNRELAHENQRVVADAQQARLHAEQALLQLETQKAATNIDRVAASKNREDIVALQATIAQLQAEIGFYRGLMDPNSKRKGVDVGSVQLFATTDPLRYRYSVVVQQVAANHNRVSGAIELSVVGRAEGKESRLSLSQVSQQAEQDTIKLKFKYFQTLEGEISLPEGFQPDWLEWQLKATVSGKTSNDSGKLAWQTTEVNYVWK